MKNIMKLVFCLSLLGAVGSANAGHLFTQALTNSPVNLTAGTGITIPQPALESASTANSSIYFLSDWTSGDSFRLTIGSFVTVVSQTVGDGVSSISRNLLALGLAIPSGGIPFNWRVDALSGDFTLAGYRLRTSAGTIDGTNSGLVNQDQVTVTPPPTGVPAPAGLALLAIGLLGMRLSQRQKA